MSIQTHNSFRAYYNGKTHTVPAHRRDEARNLDLNGNGYITTEEMKQAMFGGRDEFGGHVNGDVDAFVMSSKADLLEQKIPTGSAAAKESGFYYKSYAEMGKALDAMVEKYPGQAEKVSLGTTVEGRQIWALRVTDDIKQPTGEKPAVVVTGCHHAREWATTEVPLHTASHVLEQFSASEEGAKRLQDGEMWFVPIVNPDGYEFSREERPMWRKNRRPIHATPCTILEEPAYGVDLNRNYTPEKPGFEELYRPEGDTPCNIFDDAGGASDNPHKIVYRGPQGNSELETQAMLDLELRTANVKGVIDFHSFGKMILLPSGSEKNPVDNIEEYKRVGNLMNEAAGGGHAVIPTIDLYPATGGSLDTHQAHDIFSITMEVGRSFHPEESDLPGIVQDSVAATTLFVDEVLKMG